MTVKELVRAAVFAVFSSTLGAVASAQTAPARSPLRAPIAIVHVSVVDVEHGRLLPDQTVWLTGERIVRVLPAAKARLPQKVIRIDGRGLFLMPGLIDSHVHLNNPAREVPMLVANGVTLVRDMGGETEVRLASRQQARQGNYDGMEMLCVGTILDGDPPYHAWSRACGTPEEGRKAVRELAAAKVDQIKVYSLLKPEVHQAICDEAKRFHLKVVGHVPDALTLEQAVAAGQQGVEHLTGYHTLLQSLLSDFKAIPGQFDSGIWAQYPRVDPARLHDRLTTLVATGAAQCPTLILHAGQGRLLDARTKALWNQYAVPDDRRGWDQIPAQYADYGRSLAVAFPFLQQTVREMSQVGVPLLVGTDLGNPGVLAGFGVHREMQYWQDAGIAPATVLRAATLTPARFFQLENHLGTVSAGKTASLVLTRKNPLQDVRNVAEIEAVFARGRYFNRAALDRLLLEARDDVRAASPLPDVKPLPTPAGDVVARGTYQILYGQYGDGEEEFALTKDQNGYRFAGVRRQSGFGRYPSLQTGTWSGDFLPRQLTVEPHVLLPTLERYQVMPAHLQATVTRGGKVMSQQQTLLPSGTAFRSPLLAMDFFLFSRLTGPVGGTQAVPTVRLAQAGEKPVQQTVQIARKDDEEIVLPSGQKVTCRHYTVQVGVSSEGKEDVWVSHDGLPVRQITTQGSLKRSALLKALPVPVLP